MKVGRVRAPESYLYSSANAYAGGERLVNIERLIPTDATDEEPNDKAG